MQMADLKNENFELYASEPPKKFHSKDNSIDSHGKGHHSSNPYAKQNSALNPGSGAKSFFKGMKNKITNQLNLNDVPKEMQKDFDQMKKTTHHNQE